MDKHKKLKRAVIKEEYLVLTNDAAQALILDRFVALTYKAFELDKLIQDEKLRAQSIGSSINMPLTNGWVYKKCEDLADEIMIASVKTVRNKLNELLANKYILEKTSELYKFERTKQYKANIDKIKQDIEKLGYSFDTIINL